MRSVVSLLTLVCGVWMQAVVPTCTAAGGGAGASHVESHGAAHADAPHHGATSHRATETDAGAAPRTERHPVSACLLMTACGSAGVVVRAPATVFDAGAVAASAPRTRPHEPPSIFPGHEPPPPRPSI